MSVIERAGLYSRDQQDAARQVLDRVAKDGIQLVRLAFADQHGMLRGKAVVAEELPAVFRNGVSLTSTLLLKDTSHRTVVPVFSAGAGMGLKALEGAADVLMVPDPLSFRVLPWLPDTGWLLCDVVYPNGAPMPFCTRSLARRALADLAADGFTMFSGLEVEFHLTKLLDPKLSPEDAGQPGTPPDVALLTQGYQYLTELRLDQMEPILEVLRRNIQALNLGLRSIEVEYGPSQVEFTFRPAEGLQPADEMVLFRSAVKQVARRHGYHASFMCRPRLPNVMSSGWHLHQSLLQGGANAFIGSNGEMLSDTALHWMGGLLAEAQGSAAFTTPTINGYKRFRPYSLAPDRAVWGRDNRGVMLRVLGQPGEASTHVENRVGEPAANPYLYLASQVVAGRAGLAARLDPGPSADTPYETKAAPLPATLDHALAALDASATLRAGFGDAFIDYFLRIKRAEVARFNLEVSEWEQREYFDLF